MTVEFNVIISQLTHILEKRVDVMSTVVETSRMLL